MPNQEAIATIRQCLEQIKNAEGRFNRDPHIHATNVIEDSQAAATKALAALDQIAGV